MGLASFEIDEDFCVFTVISSAKSSGLESEYVKVNQIKIALYLKKPKTSLRSRSAGT